MWINPIDGSINNSTNKAAYNSLEVISSDSTSVTILANGQGIYSARK